MHLPVPLASFSLDLTTSQTIPHHSPYQETSSKSLIPCSGFLRYTNIIMDPYVHTIMVGELVGVLNCMSLQLLNKECICNSKLTE